jgi:hypothetical protein
MICGKMLTPEKQIRIMHKPDLYDLVHDYMHFIGAWIFAYAGMTLAGFCHSRVGGNPGFTSALEIRMKKVSHTQKI